MQVNFDNQKIVDWLTGYDKMMAQAMQTEIPLCIVEGAIRDTLAQIEKYRWKSGEPLNPGDVRAEPT